MKKQTTLALCFHALLATGGGFGCGPATAGGADGVDASDGAGEGAAGPAGVAVVDPDEAELAAFDAARSRAEHRWYGLSLVRVVHASPDAPAVDVYLEGAPAPLIRGLAYGEASRSLLVPPNQYSFALRPAGASPTSPPAFVTGPLKVGPRSRITAVAAGLLGATDEGSRFRVLAVNERYDDPGPGNVAVRLLHASPDAPAVGIDVGNDDPAAPEVPALARFAATPAGGVALPAGAALQVGVAAGGATVTAFTTPALPARTGLLVIATGLLGKLPREAAGFSLLAIGPRGSLGFIKQNPTVYALHASPDAPPVDLVAGGSTLVTDLAFAELSKPLQLPPGRYALDVFAAGTAGQGPPAATIDTPALAAGERYLAVATGFLGASGGLERFRLEAYREGFALDDAAARARVVHASPDAPAVDVGLAPGATITSVVVPDLAFAEATDEAGLSLPVATLPLGVSPAGSPHPVARFDVPTAPGLRAFVVAAGALDPELGKPFRLIAIDTAASPWTSASIAPKRLAGPVGNACGRAWAKAAPDQGPAGLPSPHSFLSIGKRPGARPAARD